MQLRLSSPPTKLRRSGKTATPPAQPPGTSAATSFSGRKQSGQNKRGGGELENQTIMVSVGRKTAKVGGKILSSFLCGGRRREKER